MKGFVKEFKKRAGQINWIEFSILLVVSVLLLLLDLFSKQYVYHKYIDTYLQDPYFSVSVIPHLFNLTLAFNKGAAWSVGFGMVGLLSMVSLIAGIVLLFAFFYYFKPVGRVGRICLALAIAGDFGNLIDRFGCWMQKGIYKDGVVDFITFDFWKSFPTFNLADSYLVIAVFILIVYFIYLMIKRKTVAKKVEEESQKDEKKDDFMKRLSEKQSDASVKDKDPKE